MAKTISTDRVEMISVMDSRLGKPVLAMLGLGVAYVVAIRVLFEHEQWSALFVAERQVAEPVVIPFEVRGHAVGGAAAFGGAPVAQRARILERRRRIVGDRREHEQRPAASACLPCTSPAFPRLVRRSWS